MNIKAVPLIYKGIEFRSSLEADWAATFDALGMHWNYEALALQLPNGQLYLPDFYLASIRCWAEVKGPHWERMDKAVELQKIVSVAPSLWHKTARVIVLEAAGPGNRASWHVPGSEQTVWLSDCASCGHWSWFERDNRCWRCNEAAGGDHAMYWPSALIPADEWDLASTFQMTRAPRPEIGRKRKGGK